MDQDSAGLAAGLFAMLFGGVFFFFMLAILAVMIASVWKVFVKAGEPGWAALIPVYNAIVLLKICGKPAWWLVLLLIPIVNIAAVIMVYISLAKCFGKDTGFAIGLTFLGFIFFPILGFGDARYLGPSAGTSAAA